MEGLFKNCVIKWNFLTAHNHNSHCYYLKKKYYSSADIFYWHKKWRALVFCANLLNLVAARQSFDKKQCLTLKLSNNKLKIENMHVDAVDELNSSMLLEWASIRPFAVNWAFFECFF